ncbi:DsbA family protein [Candidatus Uhrbacteria bacterium]|nr:DsbA family protein [Candidatus Uhrbacteria bacterium]
MNNLDIEKGFLDGVSPKTSFVFGAASGIAILAGVGFLFLMFGGGAGATNLASNDSGNQAAEAAPAPSAQPAARPPAGDPPPVTAEDHVRGDVNAPLTFIEYSDFECPFCKRFHPTTLQILDEYEGKVKFVYRHFPLSFHNPLATSEATAVECANELAGNDKYWEMSDLIFENTSSNGNGLQVSQLSDFAKDIGLNSNKFESCMNSGKFDVHILADQSGGAAAGVTGTPGSFLIDADGNAQLISGAVPYPQIKALIDAAL